MQAYSDKKRENDPHALPDVEVFYMDANDFLHADADSWMVIAMEDSYGIAYSNAGTLDDTEAAHVAANELAGWYWWSCFPGCLPDSYPVGPFPTEAEALADAQGREE